MDGSSRFHTSSLTRASHRGMANADRPQITFRGRGIGTALVQAVEEKARRAGLKGVNLEVLVESTAAMHLYERLGYSISGRPVMDRRARLSGHGGREQVEDHSWVMTKALRPPPKGRAVQGVSAHYIW